MTAISNTLAHASPRSRRWPGPAFVRAQAFLTLVWEAFAEGREMSRLAHRRYPFAEW